MADHLIAPLEPPIEAYSASELLSRYEGAVAAGQHDQAQFYNRRYEQLTGRSAFDAWQDVRRDARDVERDYQEEAEANGCSIHDLLK